MHNNLSICVPPAMPGLLLAAKYTLHAGAKNRACPRGRIRRPLQPQAHATSQYGWPVTGQVQFRERNTHCIEAYEHGFGSTIRGFKLDRSLARRTLWKCRA